MKKQYTTFAMIMFLLLSFIGCKNKDQTVSRKAVVIENEKHHDFKNDEGFGILFYKDIDDTIVRVTFYDGYAYDYIEIGDTLTFEMPKKTLRKEYKKHNMMFPEEMVIDPDSILYKKNQTPDSLTEVKRAKLRRQLMRNPLQIVASKAERIR